MLRSLLGLLTVAACSHVQEPPPPVEFERVEIEVDGSPHLLAAELTGDGHPDLAVAADGHVLVLAGDGEGGFRRAGRTPAGENPTGLAAADLDGDGDPDLAAANHETDYLTLLLNDGSGSFEPAPASPVRIEVDPHPHTVAAADLDGDGRMDLLVDHRSAGGLLPLYAGEEGGFEAGPVVELGGDPYRDVVAADLDGDGVVDLATPGERSVGLRLGRGGRQFGELRELDVAHLAPYGLTAADVNGDGIPDLAASSGEGGDGVAVLLGDGSGRFEHTAGSPYPASSGFSAIAAGDLDGDGRDDLAVTNWDSPEISIVYGWPQASDGESGATAGGGARPEGDGPVVQRVAVGENPWPVTTADFDGDGRSDLAVAVHGEGRIVVLLSRDARRGGGAS